MRAGDFLKSTLTTIEQALEEAHKTGRKFEHAYEVVEKRIETIKRLKAQLVSEQEESIRERIQKLKSALKTRGGLESELFDAKVMLREILSSEKGRKEALDKLQRLELELKMRNGLESEIFAARLELKQLYAKKEELGVKIKELETKIAADEPRTQPACEVIYPKRKISLIRLVKILRKKKSLSDIYGRV